MGADLQSAQGMMEEPPPPPCGQIRSAAGGILGAGAWALHLPPALPSWSSTAFWEREAPRRPSVGRYEVSRLLTA